MWKKLGDLFSEKPDSRIIGLIPARNESAILGQCLKALSLYTDAIVYLDDCSTDDSLHIARSLARECRIEKIMVKNHWDRDEPADRNAMLEAGRQIGGTHFIVIDADEMFTSNCLNGDYLRRKILQLKPGDRLRMNWIMLWRSLDQHRTDFVKYKDFVFCDDGTCLYESEFIHTPRVPVNLKGHVVKIRGFDRGMLHFKFVHWRNLLIKEAWYHCFERVRHPHLTDEQINEKYRILSDESRLTVSSSHEDWLADYAFFDETVFDRAEDWREDQILEWFSEYGKEHFAGLNIWRTAYKQTT